MLGGRVGYSMPQCFGVRQPSGDLVLGSLSSKASEGWRSPRPGGVSSDGVLLRWLDWLALKLSQFLLLVQQLESFGLGGLRLVRPLHQRGQLTIQE